MTTVPEVYLERAVDEIAKMRTETEKLRQWHNNLADEWAAETAKLKAELEDARSIIADMLNMSGDGPADALRNAKKGIGSKTAYGALVLYARAFLDKAGK